MKAKADKENAVQILHVPKSAIKMFVNVNP